MTSNERSERTNAEQDKEASERVFGGSGASRTKRR